MPERPIVITNPRSGAARAEKALSVLARHSLPQGRPEILRTEYAGHAVEIARRISSSCPLVIVVGGDGTINEVVNGLMAAVARPRPLPPIGLIPIGTANVLARELGIPTNLTGAMRVLTGGKTRKMDLGVARFCAKPGSRRTTRYFPCMAGAGFDAEVARAYHATRGRKSYAHLYLLPMLKTLGNFALPKIRVMVDGDEVAASACSVVVGNARSYGTLFPVAARARPDDGLLDACVFTSRTLRDFIRVVLNVLVGRHIGCREVRYRVGRHISLTSDDAVPVQLDGDFAGHLPLQLDVKPNALTFFVP